MTRRGPSIFGWLRTQPAPEAQSRAERLAAAQPKPAQRGLRDALKMRLKLERKGLNVHITLISDEDLTNAAGPATIAAAATASQIKAEERVAAMQKALRALLQRHPHSRAVLRHLALFEHVLRKARTQAFKEAPTPLLRAALQQLESIVTQWDQPALAEIRSRLAVALIERERLEDGPHHAPLRSNFLDERKLEVSEASASDFAAAEAGWAAPPVKPV